MSSLWRRAEELVRKLLRLGEARVLQNTGWLTGGKLVSQIASFIFFIVLSRRFGPEGVGIYAFAVAVASIGRTVAALGVNDYGIRELATRGSESAVSIVGRILGTQCWLAALYAGGCAVFLAATAVSSQEVMAVALLAAYHLSAGVVRSLLLPAIAEERMAGPQMLDSGSRTLAIVIGIGVMLKGSNTLIDVLVGFPVCGALLVAGAIWLGRRDLKELRIQLDINSVVTTARQAWPFAGGAVVSRLHARADVVMLSLIAGSAATGVYAAGLKFVDVSMMVVSTFAFALYPKLTRLAQDDEVGFGIAVNTLIKGGLIGCVLLGWAIFVFVPGLIPVFFGSQFQETEFVVKLFALWVPLKGAKILGDQLMLAAGRQTQKLRFQTIATGLNIAFNGILIPVLVVEGAIIASIVSVAFNAFLVVQVLQRYTSDRLLLRLTTDAVPLLAVGVLAAGIGAYAGAGEIWAAVAFITSFGGAAAVSGVLPMIWTDAAQLVARDE